MWLISGLLIAIATGILLAAWTATLSGLFPIAVYGVAAFFYQFRFFGRHHSIIWRFDEDDYFWYVFLLPIVGSLEFYLCCIHEGERRKMHNRIVVYLDRYGRLKNGRFVANVKMD